MDTFYDEEEKDNIISIKNIYGFLTLVVGINGFFLFINSNDNQNR